MRVGVDLDDVLVDFIEALSQFYNSTNPPRKVSRSDFTSYNLATVLGIPKEDEIRLMYSFYKSHFLAHYPPYPSAIRAISALKQAHDLYIITARASEHGGETTRLWLATHFGDGTFKDVRFTELNFDNHAKSHRLDFAAQHHISKLQVAQELGLDWMVEDNPHTARACSKAGIKTILVTKPWNGTHDCGDAIRIDESCAWERITEILNNPEQYHSIK